MEDPLVERYREALHADFDGTVLRTDLPNIREVVDRGPYTYAYIPLVENAIPQRQKAFRLQGEKARSPQKITRDWAEHHFIDRPPKGTPMDWLSQTKKC